MGTHPIFESDFDCLTVQINLGPFWQSWAADQLDVTGTAKTNHTPSRGSAVVFQTLRSEFTIWDQRKLFVSKKWGFTKFDKEEFAEGLKTGKIDRRRWLPVPTRPRTACALEEA